MQNGIRTRVVLRRIQKYRRYMEEPALQLQDVVRRYKGLVAAALASTRGLAQYVPGEDISGEALRGWADKPELCGPLVCQLCDAHFVYEADLSTHTDRDHGGDAEYRKRVLYLMEQSGCRPISAQS